ncbi:MAG: porin family protein [Alphaproteobacteria bacterium]|nr:porin family protein [Alphaproteobacteria bacterium]
MKKLVSIIALCAVVTPAFSATKAARPSQLTRNAKGGYDVTYSYTDKAKSGWYGAVRAELSFLNWENKYSSDIPLNASENHDKYSFEPLFAADLAFGKRINYFWRAEVEAGYISEFTDEDEGYAFKMSVPYLVANGYYDFDNGLYLGAGVGIALPTTTLDSIAFTDAGNRKETDVSPMLGLMAGYSYKLDDNIVLDLRYRIAGFYGTSQEREFNATHYFKNKIDLVLDNSISIGIRYEF